eukprot:CAMPEP_0202450070 /NCGR_PEP_ID=MMETSP1360-20130828/8725_1 /ASSEMBLY_ACC=CAM_ASM_000848 /TAXON_ID=515479 /ORGANISM="Licmophora paradoxa, Strain CCMP2313" /LENGTH=65 /DNA_ID=CAMNT_0049068205 /DNA_START=134 /DNA_END=331 /DNA_ORIENTATION=-
MAGKKNKVKEEEIALSKKDAKKVAKLESQIPYHVGRGNTDEVEKIKGQIDKIWQKTRDEWYAVNS